MGDAVCSPVHPADSRGGGGYCCKCNGWNDTRVVLAPVRRCKKCGAELRHKVED